MSFNLVLIGLSASFLFEFQGKAKEKKKKFSLISILNFKSSNEENENEAKRKHKKSFKGNPPRYSNQSTIINFQIESCKVSPSDFLKSTNGFNRTTVPTLQTYI